jgi:hypothetical protein
VTQSINAAPPAAEVLGGTISAPAPLDERFVSDKMVSDYVYLKTLGKGTFGKVRLAENRMSKQLVRSCTNFYFI